MADRIRTGKLVSLTYSIRDEHDNVLEQSDLPVNYIQGGSQELIGGMDRQVEGKGRGDEIDFELSPDESGFGPHDPDLVFTEDVTNVPLHFRELGAEVDMESEDGDVRTFYVTRIADGQLTVDGNHPLAGKALRVRVRIHDVRDPTLAESQQDLMDEGAGPLH
jgi:FKBP-type peptidyl-prolyl cis-trans isomerase SlyD